MRRWAPIIPAAILIAVGSLFLADNLWSLAVWGVMWSGLLIVLGLLWIVRGPLWLGVVVVVAGGIFLADALDTGMEIGTWWPLLIVALGVGVLLERLRIKQRLGIQPPRPAVSARPPSAEVHTLSLDTIDISATGASTHHAVVSQAFLRGAASATFGQIDLDLRQARLHEDGAEMQLAATFGQVILRVPDTWVILQEASNRFGRAEIARSDNPTEGPELRLHITTTFGHVAISD